MNAKREERLPSFLAPCVAALARSPHAEGKDEWFPLLEFL